MRAGEREKWSAKRQWPRVTRTALENEETQRESGSARQTGATERKSGAAGMTTAQQDPTERRTDAAKKTT
jgi:hypothetical protein